MPTQEAALVAAVSSEKRNATGSVSSFGFAGTIANAVLGFASFSYPQSLSTPSALLARSRSRFAWRSDSLASGVYVASDGATDIQSRSHRHQVVELAADTALMEFGMKSHQAVRLAARLQELSGLALPSTVVFDFPSPRAIAAHITTISDATSPLANFDRVAEVVHEVVHGTDHIEARFDAYLGVPAGVRLPVSTMQEQMLVHQQLKPASIIYNMMFTASLPLHCHESVARAALHAMVQRHAVLRTFYGMDATGFFQIMLPANGFYVPLALSSMLDSTVEQPFELFTSPPVRALLLLDTLVNRSSLHVVLHHIACDAMSIGILHAELLSECNALLSATVRQPLSPLKLQYADYAVWQQERYATQLKNGEIASSAAWWCEILAGAPTQLNFPWVASDFQPDGHADSVQVHIDAATVTELIAFSHACDTSPLSTLITVWASLLVNLCGQDQVVFGMPCQFLLTSS